MAGNTRLSPLAISSQPCRMAFFSILLVRDSLKELIRGEGWLPETFASGRGIPDLSTASGSLLHSARVMLPALSVSNCKRNSSGSLYCSSSSARTFPTTVQAMKAGAVECLTTPLRTQALVNAIREANGIELRNLHPRIGRARKEAIRD